MEDFYPMHMIDGLDIVIPILTNSNEILFAPTQIAEPGNNIMQNCVLYLENKGTASIIAIPLNNLTFKSRKIAALLLTAGHCISNIFSGKFNSDFISATFSVDRYSQSYRAVPLKNFLNDTPVPSISSSTTCGYCLSNDIALCLLLGDIEKSALSEVKLDLNPCNLGQEVLISGHPVFTSCGYNFPAGDKENRKDIKKKLRTTFHNYECQVNSIGTVAGVNRDHLDVKCSTTSGMSGSPAFKINDKAALPIHTSYTLCGVYVGGPPLHGQHEIVEAIRLFKGRTNRDAVVRQLQDLLPAFSSDKYMNQRITGLIFQVENSVKKNPAIESYALTLIYELVVASPQLKNLEQQFLVNSVIPSTHPVFAEIERYVRNFKSLQDEDFTNTASLLAKINV